MQKKLREMLADGQEKICLFCPLEATENVTHVVADCNFYSTMRVEMMRELENLPEFSLTKLRQLDSTEFTIAILGALSHTVTLETAEKFYEITSFWAKLH